MELKKRKYKRDEVSGIIRALHNNYQAKLIDLKTKVLELAKQNTALMTEIDEYKSNENLITSTLIRAEKNSQELDDKVRIKYELEMERLKRFSQKWDAYFKALMDKYPLYPKTREAINYVERVNECDEKDAKKIIDQIDTEMENVEPFNPKRKIIDYVAATSNNGFSMDEVLNPGELELEALCKELGLIDD